MSANDMILGLLGRKLRMTQLFEEDGTVIPVTAIEAGPCYVLNVRTLDKEGYKALQLGFGTRKRKNVSKPQLAYCEKIKVPPVAFIREVPYGSEDLLEEVEPGSQISVDIFEGVEKVDVTGISKGRGFSGTIRRHNFSRGPVTHGCKNVREPGSTGQSAYPGRTAKGKKMAGQHGNKKVTKRNLDLVRIEKDSNLIFVKGGIPGPKNGYVVIRKNIDERNKWDLRSMHAITVPPK